jgi:hypothetical protein
MVNKLNSALRTTLLLALVLLFGWWTFFLRGKLSEDEGRIEEIETLNQVVLARDAMIETLGSDLAERDARIHSQGVAITNLTAEVAEGEVRIAELGVELDRSEAEVKRLSIAVALLKVDHRVARLEILERSETEEDGVISFWTTVRFTELDPSGDPVGEPREVTVAGTRVYIEALVIKFEDDFIEAGDFLRGSSVCLFQRIFGEDQRPADGATLESGGSMPAVYRGDQTPDPFYEQLWAKFWDYAADPKAAQLAGVRAVHGEAPFVKAIPGATWRVELRSSGGLTIVAE